MMKIDRRKKYYMVLDVETANTLSKPLCYDIGFLICDKQNLSKEKLYSKWNIL